MSYLHVDVQVMTMGFSRIDALCGLHLLQQGHPLATTFTTEALIGAIVEVQSNDNNTDNTNYNTKPNIINTSNKLKESNLDNHSNMCIVCFGAEINSVHIHPFSLFFCNVYITSLTLRSYSLWTLGYVRGLCKRGEESET